MISESSTSIKFVPIIPPVGEGTNDDNDDDEEDDDVTSLQSFFLFSSPFLSDIPFSLSTPANTSCKQ